MPDVSIIIVNYKSSEVLNNCIQSIYAQTKNLSFDITVIDNNSNDPGLHIIKNKFPEINFIFLNENPGFAAGNNTGIKEASGNAILLLNPDTILLNNTIDILYKKLTSDSGIGITGPKIFYEDKTIQNIFIPKKIPNLRYMFFEIFFLDKLLKSIPFFNQYFQYGMDFTKEHEPEQLNGSCLMIRKSVLDEIGLMDQNFFLYFEETDLCFRALKKGYRIIYDPAAEIIHLEGKSSAHLKKRSIYAYYQSELYFFYKHYGILSFLILYLINLSGYILRLPILPFYLLKYKNFIKITRNFYALVFHLNLFNLKKIFLKEFYDL